MGGLCSKNNYEAARVLKTTVGATWLAQLQKPIVGASCARPMERAVKEPPLSRLLENMFTHKLRF